MNRPRHFQLTTNSYTQHPQSAAKPLFGWKTRRGLKKMANAPQPKRNVRCIRSSPRCIPNCIHVFFDEAVHGLAFPIHYKAIGQRIGMSERCTCQRSFASSSPIDYSVHANAARIVCQCRVVLSLHTPVSCPSARPSTSSATMLQTVSKHLTCHWWHCPSV